MNFRRITYFFLAFVCATAISMGSMETIASPSASTAVSTALPRLNKVSREQIKKNLELVTDDLTKRAYIRKGLYAVGGAFALYTAYQLISGLFADPVQIQHIAQLSKDPVSWSQWLQNPKTWIFAGSTIAKWAGSAIAQQVITSSAQRFIEPESLRWFVAHKASYPFALTMMDRVAKQLETAPMQDREQLIESFVVWGNRLVADLEKIVSYMKYKEKLLKDDVECQQDKVQMYQVAQSLVKQVNQDLNAIQNMLDKKAFLYLGSKVQAVAKMLHDNAQEFATLEGTQWDVLQVISPEQSIAYMIALTSH